MDYLEASVALKEALKRLEAALKAAQLRRENPLNQGPDGEARKDCVPE